MNLQRTFNQCEEKKSGMNRFHSHGSFSVNLFQFRHLCQSRLPITLRRVTHSKESSTRTAIKLSMRLIGEFRIKTSSIQPEKLCNSRSTRLFIETLKLRIITATVHRLLAMVINQTSSSTADKPRARRKTRLPTSLAIPVDE